MIHLLIKVFSRASAIVLLGHAAFILTTPLLTRIYTPQQFGVFAIFISLSSLFSGIAAAKLELVVVKVSGKERRVATLCSAAAVSIFSVLILSMVVILLNFAGLMPKSLSELGIILYFMPISVLLLSCTLLLNQYVIAQQKYNIFANSKLVFYFSLSFLSLGLGLSPLNEKGLVIAHFLAASISLTFLFMFSSLVSSISKLNLKELFNPKKALKDNFRFIKLAIPADFFANISNLSLPLLFTFLFGLEVAGFFMLAQRILSVPLNLVGNTVGQISIGEVSRYLQSEKSKIRQVYLNTSLLLGLASMSFFVPVYFAGKGNILAIFGSEWGELSGMVYILIPMFFSQLIASPTSNILLIVGGEKFAFFLNFCRAITIAVLAFLSKQFAIDLHTFLLLLVLFSCLYYTLLFIFPILKLS